MGKRNVTAEYKTGLVMEMLREEQHIGEIASREGISRTQLQNWKKEFSIFGETGKLSVKRRCKLLSVSRSSVYYEPKVPAAEKKNAKNTSSRDWISGIQDNISWVCAGLRKSWGKMV